MQERLMPNQSVYYTGLPTQRTAGGFVESLTSTLVDSLRPWAKRPIHHTVRM